MRFCYNSLTQMLCHITPFSLFICVSLITLPRDESSIIGKICSLLAFVWLILANEVMNYLYRKHGSKLGIVDLSKNLVPTPTEKIIGRMIMILSIMLGLSAAIFVVINVRVGGIEAFLLFGFGAFFLAMSATFIFITFSTIVLSGFKVRPVHDKRPRTWRS